MSDYEPKCKKTLPIIFDDRMPASNLTPKLVGRVNGNTEDLKNLYEETETIRGDIESLQGDVDEKLDIPETAGTAGQVLTSDGEGGAVWASVGSGEIVVDPTLTVEGAAADAKKTGDEITHLKQDNLELQKALGNNISGDMVTGYYINKATGGRNSNASYAYCDYFAVNPGSKIKLKHVAIYSTQGTAFYDANKTYIGYVESATTGGDLTVETTVPDGAYYLRATALVANTVIVEVLDLYSAHIKNIESYLPTIETNKRKTDAIKQSSVTNAKVLFDFGPGTINGSTGAYNPANKYRISMINFATAESDLLVSVPSGYQFGCLIVDGSAFIDSGWQTNYIIPNGASFKLSIRYTPESTSYVVTDVYTDPLYTNLSVTTNTDVKEWLNAYSACSPLSIQKLSANQVYANGACTIKNRILGFKASADDHSTTNDCFIYNPENNMALLGTMAHNLGHCNTADYCEETNTIAVCSLDSSASADIWFVKNAESKITNGGSLLISDSDVFNIKFTGLSGTGACVCFGESSDFIYVMTLESLSDSNTYKKKWVYKCILGKGTNDYSQVQDGFGTYQSGVSANEYNGTCKIVKTYLTECPGEGQGMKYRNGTLLLSNDTSVINNVLTAYLVAFDISGDSLTIKKIYEIPIYSNGAKIRTEGEGVTFYESNGYVCVINSGVGTLLKFPLAMML